MGSSALRAARWCLASLRRGSGEGFLGVLWVLALVPSYSRSRVRRRRRGRGVLAYADPAKPVLSFLLSDPRNVDEFQNEFGLSDAEVEEVLAAVRAENETLAKEYAESERIVESSKELPEDRIRSKIAASDYDEEIMAAVAETKTDIEALLPEDRRDDLKSWVDEQWGHEARELRRRAPRGR